MGFSGSAISNMLSEILRIQGSCYGNKIWAKISKNCTDFSSAQKIEDFFIQIVRFSGFGEKIEDFFTRILRFSGSANLNMLSEILREPKELPWQPNLGKKKTKIVLISVLRKK